MPPLDLTLHNYTTKELLELFDFEDNIPHNKSTVEDVCIKKINIINENTNISESKKKTVSGFFEQVKNHLVDVFFEKHVVQNEPPKCDAYKEPVKNEVQLTSHVEYTPGKVNPIRKQSLTTTYSFNTKFRKDYTTTTGNNFTIQIPNPVNNVVAISLSTFEISSKVYSFTGANKSSEFTITCKGKDIKITIPDGNYSGSELANLLNTKILSKPPLKNCIVAYYNNNNNCFSFHVSRATDFSNSNIYFSLDFNVPHQELYLNMGWILGFRKSEYLILNNNLEINAEEAVKGYRAEALYDDKLENYYYFVLNDYKYNSNRNVISIFDDTISKNNILAKIKYSPTGHTILHNRRAYLGPQSIDKIQVNLVNEYDKDLELNGMDYSFTLEIEYLVTPI